ncbi:redoxin domain-containing protein [Halioglobus maricola]|uniref:Redoxin domain-containing protein n=2 Tax=Halioglobus maricola TaxID=2601894 RepID=A0A5P9NQP0_9GAMM|nr:redoxin domain-containing protein [Halioglobus maricola]
MRVDDFVLLDQHGQAHRMHYHQDASAIVLIVHGNGCQIVRSTLPDYKALRDKYAAQGVQFAMINSNLQDNRESIAAEAAEWEIDFPILVDETQDIGRSLALTRTAEVIVVDPKTWRIVYRGAINDRVHYERQKDKAQQHYVADVLDAMIAGDAPAFSEMQSPGCIVNIPEQQAAVSYSETIAPLLIEKCASCHVEGGIAPWAMSEYRMIQGFAPMIREVLRTRRMPPWHLDPAVGEWQHDGGLSNEERTTLMAWLEAGAPRGEGADPLLEVPPRENVWTLGQPDLVIEVPAFAVPATGTVEYQFPQVANPLKEGAWVVAATVIPGDAQAVHHVLLGTVDEKIDGERADEEDIFENYIMGYAPGNESAFMPEGTGVYVPPGAYYTFQMHYTPYGKASTDVTRVGLYFAKEAPEQFLRQEVVVNPAILIPPHAADHEEVATVRFYHDATLYALTPHSHYRGKSSTFELIYPDGREELILSVPNYDFNWQRTYNFVEPKQVPAGTRIVHRTIYDNSANNPGNPDPEAEVSWGLQSEEEMLYGSVSYAWTDEKVSAPIHDDLRSGVSQWVGYLDQNLDGKVQRSEMPERLRKNIGLKWIFLDKNFDGGLDYDEMEAMIRRRQEKKDG